jgi:tetratricopeptide (TPR) repeat protein
MERLNRPLRKRKLSLPKKILFSVVATFGFFLSLEIILAVVGVQREMSVDDPFVGFSDVIPLMELSQNGDGEKILSTAKNKLRWFNAQSFPKIKEPGTKRIFCMGGSTTYGHPYRDSTSFPGWLREFLPVVDSSHQWEVINAGGISYASYRVAALMEELAQYEPDLFVVYSVHNEFLERRTYKGMFEKSQLTLRAHALLASTRTWELTDRFLKRARKWTTQSSSTVATTAKAPSSHVDVLAPEVDEILNHTIGPVDYHRDVDWRANVLNHYETNLRRMIGIAKRAGAQIVFVTPTANEKNCSPFKSEHRPGLTPLDSERLEMLSGNAESHSDAAIAANAVDTRESVESLQEAIRIDPNYADYHYRLGKAYFALHRYSDAQQSLSRAVNEDVCPLRAVPEIRQAIERVCREMRVPMVDFEHRLRQICESEHGHSILGDEYFLDHVHPTVDVNRRLALWIIEELQSRSLILGSSVVDNSLSSALTAVETKVLSAIDTELQGFSLRNLAKVLHWAGKFEEAALRARDALELLPNDPESRFVLADCLNNIGQPEYALLEYEKLFANGEDYPRAFHPYGELLAEAGKLNQAKAYLLLAILQNPNNAGAYHRLGVVHLQLGEFEFAVESLEESNRLYPGDAATLFYLETAKTKQREQPERR